MVPPPLPMPHSDSGGQAVCGGTRHRGSARGSAVRPALLMRRGEAGQASEGGQVRTWGPRQAVPADRSGGALSYFTVSVSAMLWLKLPEVAVNVRL